MATLTDRTPQEIAEGIAMARSIIIAAQADIRRIWLFGSVARDEPLDWLSDIDLAVEGLSWELHSKVWLQLEEALACGVDLVRIEEAPATLRAQIEKSGRLIHGT